MSDKPFIVYKSSAGSGKTFTLAKIYLSLILQRKDPHYFRHILALTFTVKAAAEMKQRIIAYLSDLSRNGAFKRKDTSYMLKALVSETGLPENDIRNRSVQCLDSILHNFGDFTIVTIDKFLARLMRAFASDLSLSPDFEIEVDHNQFIDQVTDMLYEEVGTSEKLTALVLEFLSYRLSHEKSGKIDGPIERAAKSILSEEFHFIEEQLDVFEPQEIFDIKYRLEHDIKAFEERAQSLALEAIDLIDNHGLTDSDLASGSRGVYSLFREIREGKYLKIIAPTKTIVKNIESDKWKSAKGSDAVDDIQQDLSRICNSIFSLEKDARTYYLKHAVIKEIFTVGLVGELIRLGDLVRNENNAYLLSDFNRIISQKFLNEQSPFIYEKLGERYNHLLIDEFQDTSQLQWQNLLPLLENSLSEAHTSLVVGDAKQSIYRFRGSDASMFSDLPEVNNGSNVLLTESYREERLKHNYRSAKNVVSFNNRFFKALTESLLSEEQSKSYSDLEQEPHSNLDGSVRWWFNPYNNKPKKSDAVDTMVNRVCDLVLNEKVPQSDICCLFRTNSDAAEVASLLLQNGIDVISEESLMLMHNPNIQLIIATLKVHQSPDDPFLLQNWLSKRHHQKGLDNYHDLAKQLKSKKWNLNELSLKTDVVMPSMESSDMFTKVYQLSSAFGCDLHDPFLLQFLDFCQDYESSSHYLKESFLDYWDRHNDKLSIALPEGKNAVRIMTIHKSKGLEFPVVVVFMPEIGKKRNTKQTAWIHLQDEPDLKTVMVNLSDLEFTGLSEFLEEENQSSELDFINVLYVAFTRAENRLEIISNQASPKSDKVGFLKTWNEWNADKNCLEII